MFSFNGIAFLWCLCLSSAPAWFLMSYNNSLYRGLFLSTFSSPSATLLCYKQAHYLPNLLLPLWLLPLSSYIACSDSALVCVVSPINILFTLNFSSGNFSFELQHILFQRNSEKISCWIVLHILCEFQTISLVYIHIMIQSFVYLGWNMSSALLLPHDCYITYTQWMVKVGCVSDSLCVFIWVEINTLR